MKNLILIGLMFASIVNYASDKNQVKNEKVNAELMCSWQYKTNYLQDGKFCYLTTDNYYFYSNNTCVKVTTLGQCNSTLSNEVIEHVRWIKVDNTIALLDKAGKQFFSFATKNDGIIGLLLQGQKVVTNTIDLPKQHLIFVDDSQLAMN